MSEDEDRIEPEGLHPTIREWLEAKLQGLRSEMRMLFVLSVAGNQLLAHLTLSTAASAATNGALVAAALMFKGGLL